MNFADRGLQLTRASRAVKIWLAIETFGLDAFRATIDRAIDQTLAAQARIEADPRLELVTPASLGVLTFRRRGTAGEPAMATDRRNEAIVRSLAASGEVLVTSTLIKGGTPSGCASSTTRPKTRMLRSRSTAWLRRTCPISTLRPRCRPGRPSRARRSNRSPWVRPGSAPRTCVGSAASRRSPTTRPIDLAVGREERSAEGVVVTERWAHARTFYIVLDGEVSVTIDKIEVNRLAGGDSFGEIAAIDWGRDFSYGGRRPLPRRCRPASWPCPAPHCAS